MCIIDQKLNIWHYCLWISSVLEYTLQPSYKMKGVFVFLWSWTYAVNKIKSYSLQMCELQTNRISGLGSWNRVYRINKKSTVCECVD